MAVRASNVFIGEMRYRILELKMDLCKVDGKGVITKKKRKKAGSSGWVKNALE